MSRAVSGGRRAIPLAWLGALPYLLLVGIFLLLPVGVNFWSSVHADGQFSLANLEAAVQGQYLRALIETAKLSGLTAVVGGLLGLLVAWSLAGEVAGPKGFKAIAYSFTTVSSQSGGVPLAFAFIATIGAQGLITLLIKGGTGLAINETIRLDTFWGLVFVYLYFQTPLMAILMVPAFQGLRREWADAAESLGASRFHYLRDIATPILLPAVLGSMLLLFTNAFAAYATAYALAGSNVNLIAIQVGFFLSGNVVLDESFAAALVTWMILIICVCLGARALLLRRASRWLQ